MDHLGDEVMKVFRVAGAGSHSAPVAPGLRHLVRALRRAATVCSAP
jgi:hypothetical protein